MADQSFRKRKYSDTYNNNTAYKRQKTDVSCLDSPIIDSILPNLQNQSCHQISDAKLRDCCVNALEQMQNLYGKNASLVASEINVPKLWDVWALGTLAHISNPDVLYNVNLLGSRYNQCLTKVSNMSDGKASAVYLAVQLYNRIVDCSNSMSIAEKQSLVLLLSTIFRNHQVWDALDAFIFLIQLSESPEVTQIFSFIEYHFPRYYIQDDNPNEPDIHRMIDDGIVLYEIFLEFKSDDEKAIINQCLQGFKSTEQCTNSVPKKRKIQDLLTNIEPRSSPKRIKFT